MNVPLMTDAPYRTDWRRGIWHMNRMQKPFWKVIASIPGLEGKPDILEYFVVREVDRMPAVAALLKSRPDLGQARIQVKGEAGQDFLDWLEPDADVFRVMAVS